MQVMLSPLFSFPFLKPPPSAPPLRPPLCPCLKIHVLVVSVHSASLSIARHRIALASFTPVRLPGRGLVRELSEPPTLKEHEVQVRL